MSVILQDMSVQDFCENLFIDIQISKAGYVSELAGYDIEDANTLIYN